MSHTCLPTSLTPGLPSFLCVPHSLGQCQGWSAGPVSIAGECGMATSGSPAPVGSSNLNTKGEQSTGRKEPTGHESQAQSWPSLSCSWGEGHLQKAFSSQADLEGLLCSWGNTCHQTGPQWRVASWFVALSTHSHAGDSASACCSFRRTKAFPCLKLCKEAAG